MGAIKLFEHRYMCKRSYMVELHYNPFLNPRLPQLYIHAVYLNPLSADSIVLNIVRRTIREYNLSEVCFAVFRASVYSRVSVCKCIHPLTTQLPFFARSEVPMHVICSWRWKHRLGLLRLLTLTPLRLCLLLRRQNSCNNMIFMK